MKNEEFKCKYCGIKINEYDYKEYNGYCGKCRNVIDWKKILDNMEDLKR
jgi:transcription initiation factor TFIIIB Brf1 subunit/transcription initiation factor TFIIB